ncbi:probable WRKY transcription factor 75 [Ananas comosus]|uniref:Probable WRKY transcription factor 75 n=1 Tax=Ananas comosus TaxID=4615 RepID=A0A6P5GMI2_ANACO|nr:probable WRKY transcription factor 75 [Ananas comosus]
MENYSMLFPPQPPSYSYLTSHFPHQHIPANNMVHDTRVLGSAGVLQGESNVGAAAEARDQASKAARMEEGGAESEAKRRKGEKKVRKPRYAFQTRSQVDILDDGYRWRKYGQKAVKNNKFPRSYYRCTHQGCNVKKQVQRLSKDEGIVVTTYEGMHTHPIEKASDNFEHILSQMQIYTTSF